MTEYNKSTVAELRKVLKDRSIPSTGLTRKQQIIEKLEEWDRENSGVEPAAQAVEAQAEKETQAEDDAPPETEPTQASTEPVSASVNQESPETLQGDAQAVDAPEIASVDAPEDASTQQPPTPSSGTATIDHAETQAPTATASVSQTPIPSAEEPIISTQQIDRSAEPSLAPTLSRLNSEERAEEHRKRKRRSESPPVGTAEAIKKKQRIDEELSGRVHLKEDGDAPILGSQKEEVPTGGDQTAQPANNGEARSADSDDGDVEMDMGASDSEGKPEEEIAAEPPSKSEIKHTQPASDNAGEAIKAGNSPEVDHKTPPPSSKPQAKDARYKSLFTPATLDSTETNHAEADSSRDIKPALHPATPAIYVGNLMRPIQPQAFRNHLISLASPPNSSPEPSLLKIFYLDPIRTHAFARFESITAASRVRAALHNVVWPADRARKALFVDFVPEDLVEQWIEAEEDAAKSHGRSASARRFEVTYHNSEAFFSEVGGSSGNNAPARRKPSMDADFNPPSGPRNSFEQTRALPPPRPAPIEDDSAIHPSRRTLVQNTPSARERERYPAAAPPQPVRRQAPTNAVTEKPFLTLDALFRSTTAKPKLYFLPVSKEKVDDRLDELDNLTSRDWKGGKGWKEGEEMRKYSFEDDRLVDGGPYRGPAGGRGGAGGGWRGGRGRGR